MKKIVVLTIIYWCLTVALTWGQDAMDFYNRGLASSLSCKRIKYFTKALQLDPNLVPAYEKRAIHYYFQGRFDNAIGDYTRVIELKDRKAQAYQMRGRAYLQKAHGEGMVAEIKRLVHRHYRPGEPENKGLLAKAIDDFSRAIELEPQMAPAYSYRAEAYRLMGNTDQAILDATCALKLEGGPKSTANAYHVLSLVYRELGENALYESAYAQYVEVDPYSPDYPPLNVPLILKSYIPDTKTLKVVQRLGLCGLIVIAFAVIFQLEIRAPKKKG